MATDSRDRVFVFNRGDHPLIVFDRDGIFLASWGEGFFVRPHGITIGPDDSLLTAFRRMRGSDVSQLPVVDQNGRAIGIIDESDLLVKVHRDPSHFNDPVKTAMTDRLETLPPNANITDLLGVFDRGRVTIVMDDDKFLGLITRTDLLSYLRLHMPKSVAPPEREFV